MIEFTARIKTIKKRLEFQNDNHENFENQRIPFENHGSHESHRIPRENHEHHENLRIPCDNFETN